MDPESESFIRWQSVGREQFGAVTNLVLGLATGLLALQSTFLLDRKLIVACSRGFGIAAILILGLSVALAIWCALNRLQDFRLTAQIARRREKGELNLDEQRAKSDAISKVTWTLFRAQLWTFGVGGAATAISVLVQAFA